MTIDQLIEILEPHLTQALTPFHELLPLALPEFEDELTATASLEIAERLRTIGESRAAVAEFQGRFLLRVGAKAKRQRFEASLARSREQLPVWLRQHTPRLWAWVDSSAPSELSTRLASIAPPSYF